MLTRRQTHTGKPGASWSHSALCRCQLSTTGAKRWKIRFPPGYAQISRLQFGWPLVKRRPWDYQLPPTVDMSSPHVRLAEQPGQPRNLSVQYPGHSRPIIPPPPLTGGPPDAHAMDMRVLSFMSLKHPLFRIPLEQIRVLNPRVRNKALFARLVENIAALWF